MKLLYIAPYSPGSTSRMRGEYLKKLLPITEFKLIDLDIPLFETNRLFRSVGWRFKMGPLINNINSYISESLDDNYKYDLVWVDKGVFIKPKIIIQLKRHSNKLVHFTPDPAFTYHRSHLFYQALPFYDYCITTKSFELVNYQAYGVNTILCTQGYDPKVHRPYHEFEEKNGVVFIGHWEKEREYIISKLLYENIPIVLAGNRWDRFAKRHMKYRLDYRGHGIYGEEYAKVISGSLMGLGFLSKWIPEKHTTRTFEIPACGTALVTERNEEINNIYSNDDVVFYDRLDELAEKIKSYYYDKREDLHRISKNGYLRVTTGPYSYYEILKNVVNQIQ